jgi:hypothetical protein
MMSLGLAWQFHSEEGAADLEKAIRSYDLSTEVYTREGHPTDWARMMFNRGGAFFALKGPDRTTNLKEAIRSYEGVVEAEGWFADIATAGIRAAREELSKISGADVPSRYEPSG